MKNKTKAQNEENRLKELRDRYNEELTRLYTIRKENDLVTEEEENLMFNGDVHFVQDIQGYAGESSNEYQIEKLEEALDNLSVLREETEKEIQTKQYRDLRKEIEAMPQYKIWRDEVLKKFSNKCVVCGSTENIEVDHRYESFYSIVKKCGIINTVQAYECSGLWNINNGAPLCKEHHDQTQSNVYYKKKNST